MFGEFVLKQASVKYVTRCVDHLKAEFDVEYQVMKTSLYNSSFKKISAFLIRTLFKATCQYVINYELNTRIIVMMN